jgi:hypothetical protein
MCRRSEATAVTSRAGANGLASMMVLGTPLEAQSSALLPLMYTTTAMRQAAPLLAFPETH